MSKRSESKAAAKRWESAIEELDAYCRTPGATYEEYERLNSAVIEAEKHVGWLRHAFR